MANTTITIEIPEIDALALRTRMLEIDTWINNWVITRSDKAKEDIVAMAVNHANENELQLPVGIDAQVQWAFDQGIVEVASNEETPRA